MQRISVVGSTGSGKTTVARAIAETLGYPHLELDSVYHQPDWVPLPDAEFREIASEFAAQGRWVIDGNYSTGPENGTTSSGRSFLRRYRSRCAVGIYAGTG